MKIVKSSLSALMFIGMVTSVSVSAQELPATAQLNLAQVSKLNSGISFCERFSHLCECVFVNGRWVCYIR